MGVIGNTIEVGKTMFEALQAENTRLREDNAALKAEVRALQPEIARLKDENTSLKSVDWTGYEPYSPIPGVTVYRFTPPAGSAAAKHLVCPKCRDIYGKKSILQSGVITRKTNCPACGTYYGFRMK